MFGMSAAERVAQWDDEIAFDGFLAATYRATHASGAGLAEGIVAGTRIATSLGWRPVESIVPGDQVMTFDHGMRPVMQVKRAALWAGRGSCPNHMMPLAVPVGALGNSAPMLLLPEQNVLVESDLAESVFGDPFALIPAAALQGYHGIERITPHQKVEIIVLEFAEEEVVYANGTGMIHCASVAGRDIASMLDDSAPYAALPMDMARAIVAQMIEAEELGLA